MLNVCPDSMLIEIFDNLSLGEQRKFKQLSKSYRSLLAPLVADHFFYDKAKSNDEELLSKYIERYGRYIKNLTVSYLTPFAVSILGKYCINTIYLAATFFSSEADIEEVVLVVELSKRLGSLTTALFMGACYLSMLDVLQPLIDRISKLTVFFTDLLWTRERASYDGPGSHTIKTLQLFNLRIFGPSFPNLISKFKNVDTVTISYTNLPGDDSYASYVISYDLQNSRPFMVISGKSPNLGMIESDTIAYDLVPENTSSDVTYSKVTLSDLYRIVALDGFHELLSNEFRHSKYIFSKLDSRDDSLENFWKSYSNSEAIGLKFLGNEINRVRIPSGSFAAERVCFKVSECLPATYFKWLATCFPNLEDLHLAKNSALTI